MSCAYYAIQMEARVNGYLYVEKCVFFAVNGYFICKMVLLGRKYFELGRYISEQSDTCVMRRVYGIRGHMC